MNVAQDSDAARLASIGVVNGHGANVYHIISSIATPDKIGHFYEEGAAVAPEAWFELVGEGAVSVAIQIVVVADVKRCAWIRGPSEQELSADVRSQRGVIDSPPREQEAGELIGRLPRIDVVVKSHAPGVVALQPAFGVVEGKTQRAGRFVSEIPFHVQRGTGAGIERGV